MKDGGIVFICYKGFEYFEGEKHVSMAAPEAGVVRHTVGKWKAA